MSDEKTVSTLDLLLRPELPDVRRTLAEKKVEVSRLSELAGAPVVFTLRALTYEQVRSVQERPRGEQAIHGVLLGCADPLWKDKSFVDAGKGIVTPLDAIKSRLTAGEIDELYAEIQVLSGYIVRTLADVKNG
ncbi:phage tail assembly chaperone [Dysosmobacter sp.]